MLCVLQFLNPKEKSNHKYGIYKPKCNSPIYINV